MPTPLDRPGRLVPIRIIGAALVALAAACGDDASRAAGIGPTGAQFGKTATSDPVVSSTSPDTGQQGTTLDVQINGGNFTTGAVATWALQGVVDTTQVQTLATKYVNSRTLIATIAIGANATLASWDVHVALSNGKNGVGSDLFTIKARSTSDASATFYVSSDPSYLLHGDAASGFVEGSSSPFAGSTRYADGECGVSATIFTSGEEVLGVSAHAASGVCRDQLRRHDGAGRFGDGVRRDQPASAGADTVEWRSGRVHPGRYVGVARDAHRRRRRREV
jgi:hypothetical protein